MFPRIAVTLLIGLTSCVPFFTYHAYGVNFNGPYHTKANCSLPCPYTVKVNNYNFTVYYQITAGNTDLPPNYFIMNLTGMKVDASNKTLTVNVTSPSTKGYWWADLTLTVPYMLLNSTSTNGTFHGFTLYADGQLVDNQGCNTGYNRPTACVGVDTNYNKNGTDFDIIVSRTGNHSFSIVGSEVAPDLPFSNVIMIAAFVVVVAAVLTRLRLFVVNK